MLCFRAIFIYFFNENFYNSYARGPKRNRSYLAGIIQITASGVTSNVPFPTYSGKLQGCRAAFKSACCLLHVFLDCPILDVRFSGFDTKILPLQLRISQTPSSFRVREHSDRLRCPRSSVYDRNAVWAFHVCAPSLVRSFNISSASIITFREYHIMPYSKECCKHRPILRMHWKVPFVVYLFIFLF